MHSGKKQSNNKAVFSVPEKVSTCPQNSKFHIIRDIQLEAKILSNRKKKIFYSFYMQLTILIFYFVPKKGFHNYIIINFCKFLFLKYCLIFIFVSLIIYLEEYPLVQFWSKSFVCLYILIYLLLFLESCLFNNNFITHQSLITWNWNK